MNIALIAQQLNINEEEITQLSNELNRKYKLDIPHTGELTNLQYDIVRSLLDHHYMICMLINSNPTKPIESKLFNEWVRMVDLSGFSSDEIGDKAAGGPYKNLQQISRMMRANGYESKIVYLGNEQQGRRWFKVGDSDIKVAKERAKERAYQARKKPRKGYTPSFF